MSLDRIDPPSPTGAAPSEPNLADVFDTALRSFRASSAPRDGSPDSKLTELAELRGQKQLELAIGKFVTTFPIKVVQSIRQLLSQQ